MSLAWIKKIGRAIDKVTRKPLEALRRRVVRNAAREKLKKHEEKKED